MKNFLLLLVSVSASALAQQLPPRDAPATPRTGTAIIAGTVVAGETGTAPVQRARVMLRSTDGSVDGQTATTDNEGGFEFRGLPVGRYTIDVIKAGFQNASYGAAKPGRSGSPVSVAEGARVTGLSIRLVRGGAITGIVRDTRGRPLPDVSVSALRLSYSWLGERSVGAPSLGAGAMTDDRGVYRVWGLPAGEYLLMATPSVGVPNGPGSGDFTRLSPGDLDAAIGLARGINTGAQVERMRAPAAALATRNYATVFHPGSADPQFAATISIGGSEEQPGVDIVVSPVPTATVTGQVGLPDGRAPGATTITLSATTGLADLLNFGGSLRPRSTRADGDGRFEFRNVAPGRYTVLAKTAPPPAPSQPATPASATPPQVMWAEARIDVNGEPQEIQLELQRAMTVFGRLVFDGTSPPPTNPGDRSVRLIPPGAGVDLGVGPGGGQIAADGTFTFTGVTPNSYRVIETSRRPWTGNWSLKSIVTNGRNALDALTVAPGEDIQMVLTYTDRPTEITGTLQDASGRPAPDYFIVVFPEDQQYWRAIRRLNSTRPGTDGHYSVKGLPAGNYLVAALTDFRSEDLYTPSFLTEVAPMAIRVTVAEGQVIRQDLKIGR